MPRIPCTLMSRRPARSPHRGRTPALSLRLPCATPRPPPDPGEPDQRTCLPRGHLFGGGRSAPRSSEPVHSGPVGACQARAAAVRSLGRGVREVRYETGAALATVNGKSSAPLIAPGGERKRPLGGVRSDAPGKVGGGCGPPARRPATAARRRPRGAGELVCFRCMSQKIFCHRYTLRRAPPRPDASFPVLTHRRAAAPALEAHPLDRTWRASCFGCSVVETPGRGQRFAPNRHRPRCGPAPVADRDRTRCCSTYGARYAADRPRSGPEPSASRGRTLSRLRRLSGVRNPYRHTGPFRRALLTRSGDSGRWAALGGAARTTPEHQHIPW